MRINFTRTALGDITLPASGKRIVLKDTKIPGLQCRVTAAGVKTFCVYRRVKGGLAERITLGRFPEMTVEQARMQAEAINAKLSSGKSAAQIRRDAKAEMTFGELFQEYFEKHSRVRKRAWKDDEIKYRLYLAAAIGRKKLSSIERREIILLYTGICRKEKKSKRSEVKKYISASTANRVLALISSVFNWGILTGACDENPASRIKKNKENSRDRFLQVDELPRFFKAVEQEKNTTIRDYVLLSLLTGARRANVLSMRWVDISFERKEWRINDTKNGQPQTVALTDEVLHILKERQAAAKRQVFTDEMSSGKHPYTLARLMGVKAEKVFALQWNEVNLLAKSWTSRVDTFGLADEAVDLLIARKRNVETYVFAGWGRKGYMVEPKTGWLRILTRAQISNLRIHDLRRTFGSWQARTGASLLVIGKSLGHKSQQSTAIYARLDLDPVRKSVETATAAMLHVATVKGSLFSSDDKPASPN